MRLSLLSMLLGVPLASCSRSGLLYYDIPKDAAPDAVSAADAGGDSGFDDADAPVDASSCAAPAATVLAQSTQTTTAWTTLAQDDQYLYWCAQHSGTFDILRMSKCGGPIDTLQTIFGYPYSMLVDATTLYFTATGPMLASIPKGGGAVTKLYDGGVNIKALALDANVLYFDVQPNLSTAPYQLDVRSIPIAGGPSALLASGYSGVVTDHDWIYTSSHLPEDTRLVALPKAGGTPADLAAWSPAFAIAVDSSGVYYATQDLQTSEGSINLVSVGVPAKQIAGNLANVVAIALDANYFYTVDQMFNGPGFVKQWAKTGGMATPLATTTQPSDLLVDPTSLYWIDNGGAVMKQDKP